MTHNNKKNNGFTLMEILIAMFIFAIVVTLVSVGLNMILRAERQINFVSEQLAQAQLAETIMTRDISQIINRPIRNEFGELSPALLADPSQKIVLEFTRAGVPNPFGRANRSTLVRVAYEIVDNNLIRKTWRVLDRAPRSEADSVVLLSNVKEITFRWLVEDEFVLAEGSVSPLPAAIQFTIIFDNKIMDRIVPLPGGL